MKAAHISNDVSTTSSGKTVSYPFQLGVVPPMKQIEDDYNALKEAVKSGNVANAQNAFAALQKDKKTAVENGAVDSVSPSSQLGADFQTLQTALQSGNVQQVQNAFAAVDKVVGKAFEPDSTTATGVSAATNSVSAISASDAPTDSTDNQYPGSVLSVHA